MGNGLRSNILETGQLVNRRTPSLHRYHQIGALLLNDLVTAFINRL